LSQVGVGSRQNTQCRNLPKLCKHVTLLKKYLIQTHHVKAVLPMPSSHALWQQWARCRLQALSCTACLEAVSEAVQERACKQRLACCCFFLCKTFLLLYLGSFEQHVPHFLLACGVSCFLHLMHMTFANAGCPQLSSLLWELLCVQLLFWPVEVIMVGFFTVREFQIMANGWLELFPPNRVATFPEFHNLEGIPQETSYLFVREWLLRKVPLLRAKVQHGGFCTWCLFRQRAARHWGALAGHTIIHEPSAQPYPACHHRGTHSFPRFL